MSHRKTVEDATAVFSTLPPTSAWLEEIDRLAAEAQAFSPEQRLAVAVAVGKSFQRNFNAKGVDTELLRAQIARRVVAMITNAGVPVTAEAGRMRLSLLKRSRDHDQIVTFGEELIASYPEQAAFGNEAVGAALFNLKRHNEALARLTAVPEERRSDSTRNLLERLAASGFLATARAKLEAAFAQADEGDATAATITLREALHIAHPDLGDALPLTFAVLAGDAPVLGAPPAQASVTPLFCAGFRWSGASAVYDFLAQQQDVAMFPRRPRFMQDSADAMEAVISAAASGPSETRQAVRAFVCRHVLGVGLSGGAADMLKGHEQSILKQFDSATDFTRLDDSLARWAQGLLAPERADAAERAPRLDSLLRAISALAAPEGERYVLFDSVIRAAGAGLLAHLPGARMVVVLRDPRDMYVTHVERGSWSRGVTRYIRELAELFGGFETASASGDVAAQVRAVQFEAFIQSSQEREALLAWLNIHPGEERTDERRFFPEQSASNIGLHRAFPDRAAIGELEGAFGDRLVGGPASSPQSRNGTGAGNSQGGESTRAGPLVDVLTFSAMATRRQQQDKMGLAGLPGEPGWRVRRELSVRLFREGSYDFIGLQHTYMSDDDPYDAAGWFLSQLNEGGEMYGVVNRAAGADPKVGDSTPLYYRKSRWELDPAEQGATPFDTPAPSDDEDGGGGLLFIHGLFHEREPDGARTGRKLYVYNVRLRNRDSDVLDVYRTRCFLDMDRHIAARAFSDAPVVVLGDTNTKIPDTRADRVMRGLEVEIDGEILRPRARLQDTLLALYPNAHGGARTQHNFEQPGSLEGSDRNDRILATIDLSVVEAEIMTFNVDGQYPSYHYPVRARLRFER